MEPDIAPLAKRLAEENNVAWQQLNGSGANGRIVERDVLEYLARVMSGDEALNPTAEPVPEGMEAWPEEDTHPFFADTPVEQSVQPQVDPVATLEDDLLDMSDDPFTDDLGFSDAPVEASVKDTVDEDIFLFEDDLLDDTVEDLSSDFGMSDLDLSSDTDGADELMSEVTDTDFGLLAGDDSSDAFVDDLLSSDVLDDDPFATEAFSDDAFTDNAFDDDLASTFVDEEVSAADALAVEPAVSDAFSDDAFELSDDLNVEDDLGFVDDLISGNDVATDDLSLESDASDMFAAEAVTEEVATDDVFVDDAFAADSFVDNVDNLEEVAEDVIEDVVFEDALAADSVTDAADELFSLDEIAEQDDSADLFMDDASEDLSDELFAETAVAEEDLFATEDLDDLLSDDVLADDFLTAEDESPVLETSPEDNSGLLGVAAAAAVAVGAASTAIEEEVVAVEEVEEEVIAAQEVSESIEESEDLSLTEDAFAEDLSESGLAEVEDLASEELLSDINVSASEGLDAEETLDHLTDLASEEDDVLPEIAASDAVEPVIAEEPAAAPETAAPEVAAPIEEAIIPTPQAIPTAAPLVSYGVLLRQRVDLTEFASTGEIVASELGENANLAAAFILRAISKAVGQDKTLGWAQVTDSSVEVKTLSVQGSLRDTLTALESAEVVSTQSVDYVIADMSALNVDEVFLNLGVPALALSSNGDEHSLSLSGSQNAQEGTQLLADVAELLANPVKLIV